MGINDNNSLDILKIKKEKTNEDILKVKDYKSIKFKNKIKRDLYNIKDKAVFNKLKNNNNHNILSNLLCLNTNIEDNIIRDNKNKQEILSNILILNFIYLYIKEHSYKANNLKQSSSLNNKKSLHKYNKGKLFIII